MPASPCKPPGDVYGYGDVNENGTVSSSDALYISQHLEGTRTLTPAQLVRANVKGYGNVSSADATLILDFAVGKITTFPVCGAPPPTGDIVDDTKTFTVPLTTTPAKGEIVSINAPSSAKHNERITVNATIKNTGSAIGRFKIEVNVEASGTVQLSPGQSRTFSVYAMMPSTGKSATLTLKCIRIT